MRRIQGPSAAIRTWKKEVKEESKETMDRKSRTVPQGGKLGGTVLRSMPESAPKIVMNVAHPALISTAREPKQRAQWAQWEPRRKQERYSGRRSYRRPD